MEINLNNPYEVVIVERKAKTVDKLTVRSVIDYPIQKKVIVQIKEFNDPIILWEGNAYDTIGQWTDTDVQSRLNELYNS